MAQCHRPCKVCKMTVCVLIETKSDSREIASIVNHVMEESDYDDVSVIFRINGVDQAVRCPGKKAVVENYSDCLF